MVWSTMLPFPYLANNLIIFISFLKPDRTRFHFYSETFLGTGTNLIILRHGPYALKIPKV